MTVRLKEIMKEKGVNGVSLAKSLGISRVTVSNFTNGRTVPSVNMLERMAQVLDVPLWQLFADPSEVVTEKVEVEKRVPEFIVCPHCGMAIPVEVSVRSLKETE